MSNKSNSCNQSTNGVELGTLSVNMIHRILSSVLDDTIYHTYVGYDRDVYTGECLENKVCWMGAKHNIYIRLIYTDQITALLGEKTTAYSEISTHGKANNSSSIISKLRELFERENSASIIEAQKRHIVEIFKLSFKTHYYSKNNSCSCFDRYINNNGNLVWEDIGPVHDFQSDPICDGINEFLEKLGSKLVEDSTISCLMADDIEQKISTICKAIHKDIIAPIIESDNNHYSWLRILLTKRAYWTSESLNKDRLFDFLAIVSILSLDLKKKSEKSIIDQTSKVFMKIIYFFVCGSNESEFEDFYKIQAESSCENFSNTDGSEQINDPSLMAKHPGMIETRIRQNQELEELKSQLDDILKRLREMIAWYDQFRYDSDEIAREIDKARSCIASLKDHFDECYEAGSVIGMRQEIKNINSVINKSSSLLHSLSTQLTQNRSN